MEIHDLIEGELMELLLLMQGSVPTMRYIDTIQPSTMRKVPAFIVMYQNLRLE